MVEQIFESYEAFQEEGWDYTFEASFLEIYNDQIRDLLAEPGKDVPHQIIHERDGRTYASDLITGWLPLSLSLSLFHAHTQKTQTHFLSHTHTHTHARTNTISFTHTYIYIHKHTHRGWRGGD